MQQPLAFPSPSQGVWHLGPFPLRAYALMIILGIVVAVWLGERRWAARGGTPGVVIDIAVWAVPFGLIGGRLYHVITDNQMYFGAGKDPLNALKVWNGGLGIWGAVALGAVGAYIGCRRRGVDLRPFADAIAPGIALAQGIGRWGNWFNQELYGRPTSLPWAVTIDQDHRPRLSDGSLDPRYADVAHYHPTFLYESLWCFGVAVLVIWAGRRYKLNYGRSFALYIAAYTVGRAWIEWLRIDSAHHFLGLRLNDYTALIVFICAVAYLYVYRDKGDVEEVLETRPLAEPGGAKPSGEHSPLEEPEMAAVVAAEDHAGDAETSGPTKTPAQVAELAADEDGFGDEEAATYEAAHEEEPASAEVPGEEPETVVPEEDEGPADEVSGESEELLEGEAPAEHAVEDAPAEQEKDLQQETPAEHGEDRVEEPPAERDEELVAEAPAEHEGHDAAAEPEDGPAEETPAAGEGEAKKPWWIEDEDEPAGEKPERAAEAAEAEVHGNGDTHADQGRETAKEAP